MAILSDYTAGTISVSANGTAVTGVGTAWQTAAFTEGDWFIAGGWVNVVASVDSETTLTLAQPWGGGTLSGEAYRLRYMSDGSRASAQARRLIDLLGGSGNLEALAGLVGSAEMVPYFTGAGTMGLVALDALGGAGGWDAIVSLPAGLTAYVGEADGFRVLVVDNDGNDRSAVYELTGGVWSDPIYVTGPIGPDGPGADTLDELTDVTLTTPQKGDALRHDGSEWINHDASGWTAVAVVSNEATIDIDDGDKFLITVDDDCELQVPENAVAGAPFAVRVVMSGSHAFTFATGWLGEAPQVLSATGDETVLTGIVLDTGPTTAIINLVKLIPA